MRREISNSKKGVARLPGRVELMSVTCEKGRKLRIGNGRFATIKLQTWRSYKNYNGNERKKTKERMERKSEVESGPPEEGWQGHSSFPAFTSSFPFLVSLFHACQLMSSACCLCSPIRLSLFLLS